MLKYFLLKRIIDRNNCLKVKISFFENFKFLPFLAKAIQDLQDNFMILGITGAIGCGKSTVLSIFSDRQWRVFDADKLCHKLYDGHDRELCTQITERWGKELLLPDGSICRKTLGKIVFADPGQLEMLTDLLYPALRREILQSAEYCRRENINAAAMPTRKNQVIFV